MQQSPTIPVLFDNDTFLTTHVSTLDDLLYQILTNFKALPHFFKLFYEDSDGDIISLQTQEDFEAMLQTTDTSTLSIKLEKADTEDGAFKKEKRVMFADDLDEKQEAEYVSDFEQKLLNYKALLREVDYSMDKKLDKKIAEFKQELMTEGYYDPTHAQKQAKLKEFYVELKMLVDKVEILGQEAEQVDNLDDLHDKKKLIQQSYTQIKQQLTAYKQMMKQKLEAKSVELKMKSQE